MEPRKLLQLLMDKRGLNPSSLARATKDRTKQPQIYRFLKGEAKEPKRSTLEPVAEVLGIPVEALFDAETAAACWAKQSGERVSDVQQAQPPRSKGSSADAAADALPALATFLLGLDDLQRTVANAALRHLLDHPEDVEAVQAQLRASSGATPGKRVGHAR